MRKYWAFFSISAKHSFANKPMLIGISLLLLILLFIYNQLWTIIGSESNANGINTNFIWYLLLGEIIILSTARTERIIEDDIHSGTMAYYLNKPVSFFCMRFIESVSTTTVPFLFMLLIGGGFVLIITSGVPFQWIHFPFIILATYISCIINVLLYSAVGYCALWLKEIRTTAMAVQRLAFIFGGAIFPLTIYPEWFINIAKWTPFYSVYYLTIKLVYDFSWYNFAEALILNLTWTVIIGAFLYLSYKHLSKKVNINGG